MDGSSLAASAPTTERIVVPAAHYISREFAALEFDKMWRKTWQVACREEELPKVGDYVTYDIVDESISIVRSAEGVLSAYYNVCPHRGRRLTIGCGHTAQLHCRYHGWKWGLDGANVEVVDRQDWGAGLTDDDLTLVQVKVDAWGGFVFINLDPGAEPLVDYLGVVRERLDPLEIQAMRYMWRKSTILPCNWKVALEAFNEGYHVQTTHRQLLDYVDDYTYSEAHGKHGNFGYRDVRPTGAGSTRLGPAKADIRPGIVTFFQDLIDTLNATITRGENIEMKRLMDEVPADADVATIMGAVFRLSVESAVKSGAGYPNITPEQFAAVGTDWHVFPNTVMLPLPLNVLGYRARPNGHDPDSCIFEVYSLDRVAPGSSKPVANECSLDIADQSFWGLILTQDFANMGDIQKGMKSAGFKGARPSPKQEVPIANFHRVLDAYVNGTDPG